MSDLPITYPAAPVHAPILQALDIQHDTDPADDHSRARRIPHLGHALLFFVLVFLCIILGVIAIYAAAHIRTQEGMRAHQDLAIAGQAAAYVVALLIAAAFFPLLWHKSFWQGIEWNPLAARRNAPKLVLAALALSVAAQTALHFIPVPQNAPIEDMFKTQGSVWLIAIIGVILGPLMEEIAFRGFLLPALATAYDWLTFPRTPAGLDRWRNSTAHTTAALIVATLLSSLPFAVMHAAQIGYAWGVVGVLYGVSLVLSYVRLRFHSVACSTLMHATYNLTIFAAIFLSTGGFRHLDRIH